MQPDQDRLRDSIKERFIEMWGVDIRSEVEQAMVEQEIDWVLALIAREVRLGKIEELQLLIGAHNNDPSVDDYSVIKVTRGLLNDRIAELSKEDTPNE